jgi:hypothetical protein
LPVVPEDPFVGSVLAPVDGLYSAVLGFSGGALSYYPDLPDSFNTLLYLDPLQGYWIKMEQDATLVVRGYPLDTQTPIPLQSGWNLVAYLPSTPLPIATALASLGGSYDTVLGYDGGGLSYYPALPPQFNTLQTLQPGRGYWIRMKAPAVLVYPE